jgi:hypothetical protein
VTKEFHSHGEKGAMEYGLQEVVALAASGAVGALLMYGY